MNFLQRIFSKKSGDFQERIDEALANYRNNVDTLSQKEKEEITYQIDKLRKRMSEQIIMGANGAELGILKRKQAPSIPPLYEIGGTVNGKWMFSQGFTRDQAVERWNQGLFGKI